MNRFSQKDTLRGSIADPVSLNRYLYCQSDPVNFADYNGLQMVNVCVADGGGGSGRKTNTPANILQKAGQAIKTAVSSAAAVTSQARTSAKSNGEAIVVSGSEHYGNRFRYNFIESGIKGIKNYQVEGYTTITWIVFKGIYTEKELERFKSTAESLGVNFISVNNNQEFFNYLNTGNTSTVVGTREKAIINMVIYGHGYPGQLELGQEPIDQISLAVLKPEVFDNAKTVLYTCRGANETAYGPAIAQTISNITGGDTLAILGRAEYSYIAYTKGEIETKKELKDELMRSLTRYASLTWGFSAGARIEPDIREEYINLGNRISELLELALQDDEIETMRKEFGYLQDGAHYDPIPGKMDQDDLNIEEREPAEWKTFSPKN